MMEFFLENKDKNNIVIIMLILLFFCVINNVIFYIILILMLKTKNKISYITKIVMLQTYFYYFLKFENLRNNKLKLWLSSMDSIIKTVFVSQAIFKIIFFGLILAKFPAYIFLIIYFIWGIKNYYLYTLDYMYDSFSVGYYFEEEMFLTNSGLLKIKKYKNYLIFGEENDKQKLYYYSDYNHTEY
ncbi:MAG: hypothetical protein EOP33_06430 [Rickettsiaceae bacterium]|nr:MAG: hypothetical protein EOP33_06430 [Rickettsiaceae bacterium]